MNHVEGSFNRSLIPKEVDSTGILSARVRLKGNRCPAGAAAGKGKSAGLLHFQRETCFDILMARVSGSRRWSGDKCCSPPRVIAGQDGDTLRFNISGRTPSPPRQGAGQVGAGGKESWRSDCLESMRNWKGNGDGKEEFQAFPPWLQLVTCQKASTECAQRSRQTLPSVTQPRNDSRIGRPQHQLALADKLPVCGVAGRPAGPYVAIPAGKASSPQLGYQGCFQGVSCSQIWVSAKCGSALKSETGKLCLSYYCTESQIHMHSPCQEDAHLPYESSWKLRIKLTTCTQRVSSS